MRNDITVMRAVAELAASQHSAFTRRQAASVGMTRSMLDRRLDHGDLTEPAPGVLFHPSAPMTFKARLSIATLAGGGTVGSHRAAGLVHGADGIETAPVEVLVPRGRYPSIDGVVVHRAKALDPRDVVRVDGIPVVSVARMLAELGAVADQDAVERALDWALRTGYSERWIRQVHERLERPGPSGTATLRRVLDDPGRSGHLPANWFERLVDKALRAPDLPPLALQYELRDPRTDRVLWVLDGCFVEWGIGIEGHSKAFHEATKRTWQDMERDNDIRAMFGIELVYVTWKSAHHPERVLDRVRAIHRRRTAA